jgi:hypothetical protein
MNFDAGISLHEHLASLFQTDTLLVDQYYDTVRRRIHLEPERKLMLAVLEDAVVCFQKHIFARDRKGKRLHQEAEEWILDCSNDWPFSFDTICEILGFNANYVRRGLLGWKRETLARYANVSLDTPFRRSPERSPGRADRILSSLPTG